MMAYRTGKERECQEGVTEGAGGARQSFLGRWRRKGEQKGWLGF